MSILTDGLKVPCHDLLLRPGEKVFYQVLKFYQYRLVLWYVSKEPLDTLECQTLGSFDRDLRLSV